MKTFVQVFPNKEIKNLLKPKSAYEYISLFYFPVTRHALVLPITGLITFSLEVKRGPIYGLERCHLANSTKKLLTSSNHSKLETFVSTFG